MQTTCRQRLVTLVSLALCVCLVVAFASGVVLGLLDPSGVLASVSLRLHAVSSYALIGLSALHVAFYWRTLAARTRRWLLSPQFPTPRTLLPRMRPSAGGAEQPRAA